MFLNKFRNIFCVSDENFVSATNVACALKPGNICVRNDVSSFAGALTVHVVGSLEYSENVQHTSELQMRPSVIVNLPIHRSYLGLTLWREI